MATLYNTALVTASAAGQSASGSSIAAVTTYNVDITKTANPEVWLGGELVFTITVVNNESGAEAVTLENVVITDNIDAIWVPIAGSIDIETTGGATTGTGSFTGNVLTVDGTTIPPGGSVTVTFRVTEAP